MKAQSIRTRLYLVTSAALILTALLISAANVIWFQGAYRQALEDRSIVIAQNLRETVYKNLQFFPLDGFAGMTDYMRTNLKTREGISYGYISDRTGRILYHTDESKVGTTLDSTTFAGMALNRPEDTASLAVGNYYESVIPIVSADEVIGAVHIGIEKRLIDSKIAEMILQSAAILILVLGALAYPLYLLLSRNIATPLSELTSAVKRIAAGDLNYTVQVGREDEIGVLARTFSSMTVQLRDLISSLEQRVAERTADLKRRSIYLEAAAEVGRAAASILKTDELAHQVAALIQERFGLYYVGLFLVDQAHEWAVLKAGTGEAGQIMLARGHRLQIGGSSMIGWCISNAQARVALEVSGDSVRLATVELPDTRSEAALPLRSRGQVIGALTVQSTQPDAFDPAAIAVLQMMADQVAVALDNAGLFAESQAALEASRRAYGELGRQAWMQMARTQHTRYLCKPDGIHPAQGEWEPEMVQASQTGQTVQDGGSTVALPIKIRDQVLGVMRLRKFDHAGKWTPEEVTLVQTLGDQLSTALEGARLYQDTQRRAARERLVGDITARMRESLEMETVLKTAAEQMRQSLGFAEVEVRLDTPQG